MYLEASANFSRKTLGSVAEQLSWTRAMEAPKVPVGVIWQGKLVQRRPGAVRIAVKGDVTALMLDGTLELLDCIFHVILCELCSVVNAFQIKFVRFWIGSVLSCGSLFGFNGPPPMQFRSNSGRNSILNLLNLG